MAWRCFIQGLVLIGWFATPTYAQNASDAPVAIQVESFGAGNWFRPGDFTAVRLQLTSNLAEPATDVHLVWEVPEGLGDVAEITRPITLTRGQPLSVWLYAKLLPTASVGDVWAVRVYRDVDGERRAELASAPISPAQTLVGAAQMAPLTRGMIAIVGGPRQLGLQDFNVRHPGNGALLTGHEVTEVVAGLSPRDIPDRWEGLDSYEAIIWTDAPTEGLRESSARALREYMLRGGHLIIVVPSTGDLWGIGGATGALSDLLPSIAPRTDTASVRELLPILSKRTEIAPEDDFTMPIHVFESQAGVYQPLLALPDRRVVGIERLVGHGRLTILGVDLNSGQLLATPRGGLGSYVEADVIWNRILGRRADALNRRQVAQLSNDRKIDNRSRRRADGGKGQLILDEISLSGRAFTGITLAFLLFAVYWVVAGPGGFALLKSTRRIKHAWVAFALSSAVFTIVAWGSVKLFSQKNVIVEHLTVLDYVYPTPGLVDPGAPNDLRGSSWFTVFLPGYGNMELAVEGDATRRDLLAAFSAPGVPQSRFRNVDRYEVSNRSPATYEVPVRATTKELYARWLGQPDPEWSEGFRVDEEIQLVGGMPRGRILHDLPGEIDNIQIIVVQAARTQPRRYSDPVGDDAFLTTVNGSGLTLNRGTWWDLGSREGDRWRRLEPLDLGARIQGAGTAIPTMMGNLGERVETEGVGSSLSRSQRMDFLTLLSFFHQAGPPPYNKREGEVNLEDIFTYDRYFGRELDLSVWFSRPCVIIMGELRNSELPIPFKIGPEGSRRRPVSEGTTIVRFIYPLPTTVDDVVPSTTQ